MTDEELQFEISQYVDGMLSPQEAAALEVRLAQDPAAKRMLAEYRRLNMLMTEALPVPEMDWDTLAKKISHAVDSGAAVPAEVVAQASQSSYRTSAFWGWKPLALAASLLICATVALVATRKTDTQPRPADQIAQATPSAPVTPAPSLQTPAANRDEIAVNIAQRMTGDSALEVQIGPGQSEKPIDWARLYPEMRPTQEASISIAGSPSASRDEELGLLQ